MLSASDPQLPTLADEVLYRAVDFVAVVTVGHDDKDTSRPFRRHEIGFEAIVDATMFKSPRRWIPSHNQPQSRTALHLSRQHLSRRWLLQKRILFTCIRLLDSDCKSCQVGGRRP